MPVGAEEHHQEELVVVFTNARSFSRAMNETGSGRMLEFLDEMYARLGEEVVRRGGEVIKYLGDGLLAVFAVNDDAPAATRRAVEAGVAMRRAYAELVSRHGLRVATELEVGVSLGRCERGIVGHESLRCADVFGEAVSVAAVIGHHRGIAVTAQVREALGSRFATTQLPHATVKWLDAPLELWEIDDA